MQYLDFLIDFTSIDVYADLVASLTTLRIEYSLDLASTFSILRPVVAAGLKVCSAMALSKSFSLTLE